MKILVTGATGLVGNNCVRYLVDDHDVHVLVRKGSDQRPFQDLHVSFHEGDLCNPDSLGSVIPEVDAMIHSAGDTHIGKQPRPVQRLVNTEATTALADIAHRQGCRFVFVSSVDALPAGAPDQLVSEETAGQAKSSIGYVVTKRAAEAELLQKIESGLDAVIANPGFMLGPWDWKPSSGRMLLEVATRFTPFGPSGGFSVCDVRDVAEALCRLATSNSQHRRYILAGHNLTYVDAWRVFARVAGSRPPWTSAGPGALRMAGWWGDLMTRISGKEGDVNSGAIGMAQLFHYYDSSRAVEELNYRIRPLEETVTAAWTWFQDNGFVAKTA